MTDSHAYSEYNTPSGRGASDTLASDWEDGGYNSGSDPFEAIYALNIGDFITESFMSDDLVDKIQTRLGDDPQKLVRQIEELVQIYSLNRSLALLDPAQKETSAEALPTAGSAPQAFHAVFDGMMHALANMAQFDQCHLMLRHDFTFGSRHHGSDADTLSLVGSTGAANTTPFCVSHTAHDPYSLTYYRREAKAYDLSSAPSATPPASWQPVSPKASALLAVPLLGYGQKPEGLLLFEHGTPRTVLNEELAFAQEAAKLIMAAITLQGLSEEATQTLSQQGDEVSLNTLRRIRAEMTDQIAELSLVQQQFLEGLSATIDARQQFTRGHSKRVAEVAKAIAEALYLNEKTVELVEYAALLGNIGKVNVPNQILEKKEALSLEEWESLQEHPNLGVRLMMQVNILSEISPYLQYQNERWDGSGHPERLKGENIPLGSRILAVATAYTAMREDRPYRTSDTDEKAAIRKSHSEAVALLQQEQGAKWDPLVVNTFARLNFAALKA